MTESWKINLVATMKIIQEEIHQLAREKGWWDKPRSEGELIALCHSELSEALEAYREGADNLWFGDNGKPEGLASELADCVIRIFDMSEYLGIDLGGTILMKHNYNKTRSYRHGNKVI